jgi:hypothetical protein
VVSHPYDSAGAKSGMYEVLELSAAGALTRPGTTFEMGRASFGSIVFTPDGEVGLVATEDGKLGVFRLVGGVPAVVHAAFDGAFYASRVVIEPRGDSALVLDGNWRENGGGIYRVTIGCDGTLTEVGKVAAAKLPAALAFTDDAHVVVAATDVMDSTTAGHDVHLLGWSAAPSVLAGSDAFGDDMAIVGGAALTADKQTFLVGDTSQFANVPNRVAAVKVTATGVAKGDVVPVEDPAAIAASPFGNVAIVASAFGDAIYILDINAGAWRVRGQVAYVGGSPKIPADVAQIDRGTLRGHVLVSENVGVRHLAFRETGAVDDLGSITFGMGLQNIAGAIGVTP